jgi:hypothetical protein
VKATFSRILIPLSGIKELVSQLQVLQGKQSKILTSPHFITSILRTHLDRRPHNSITVDFRPLFAMAEEKPITSLREALSADIDAIAKLQQFTQTYHRDVYPAIDARNQSLSAAGKTVMITGGGAGIGKVRVEFSHGYHII